jgi:6-hydroxynicotinate reductase
VMVDVTRMPENSFGYVPTPAIVAPMEFTLPRDLYERLGGHAGDIVSVAEMLAAVAADARVDQWRGENPWPFDREAKDERAG